MELDQLRILNLYRKIMDAGQEYNYLENLFVEIYGPEMAKRANIRLSEKKTNKTDSTMGFNPEQMDKTNGSKNFDITKIIYTMPKEKDIKMYSIC